MAGVSNLVKRDSRRMGVIIGLGILILIATTIEYNFILPMFYISNLKSGNMFDSIMNIIQIILGMITKMPIQNYLIILVAFVPVSAIMGLYLSGLLYSLNQVLEGKEKEKGEILSGIKKFMPRISVMVLKALVVSSVFPIFLLVTLIPGLVVTRAVVAGKEQFMLVAVILDSLTVLIVFFGIMFFRVYLLYWFAAAFNSKRKVFAIGKHVADLYFWRTVAVFLIMDIMFVAFECLIVFLNSSFTEYGLPGIVRLLLVFIPNFIFKLFYVVWMLSFVFSKFIEFKESVEK